jgi:hypothetical protein
LVVLLGAVVSAQASVALTQVSTDPYLNKTSFHATQVEPDTFAVGSTIVAAFQSGRFADGGSSNIGWATSTNRGSSYAHGFLPGTTAFSSPRGPYARVTDPSVAFDAKHGAWLINSLGLTQTNGVNGAAVIVSRSTNGGLTWGNPVTIARATSTQDFDKNWIVCDDSTTSPHYGSCYAEWDDFGNGNQLHVAFSRDGGITWTQSTVPSAGVIGGQPLVQPNGTVIMPINDEFGSTVESFVSKNGGLSYSGPFSIAVISSHTEGGGLRSSPLPTAEIDGAGKVYVAWSDCRFITSCAGNDIVFSTSTDGAHWSTVKRIPIGSVTSGRDEFLPGLGVDRSTSGSTARLALTYYYYPVSNCTTATCRLDVGFVSSSDGGTSWAAPVQLAGPSTLSELPDTSLGFMVGDYLSSSFVTGALRDAALSVFAVGMRVTGKTCTLGDVSSCNEPMEAPSSGLRQGADVSRAVTGPIRSKRSDHAAAGAPLARR